MIIVSLEKRDLQVRIQIRDTSTVRPGAGIRMVDAKLFTDFASEWKSLYRRSEAVMQLMQSAAMVEIEGKIRRKGKALTSLIFAQEAPEFGEGPLLFSFDPSLSGIPFEILYVDQGFVCDRLPLLREVLTPRARTRSTDSEASANRAVLMFDGSFSHELSESVQREKSALLPVFQSRSDLTTKLITSKPADAALLEDLVEARYVHFSGHHESGERHTPFISSKALEGTDLHCVEAAFINACHSAETSGSTLTLAEAMIQSGVKNFVGFGLPVETGRAEVIAASFWKRVLSGSPVTEVVQNLRREIRAQYGAGCLEWASLQHFGTFRERASIRKPRRVPAAAAIALLIPMLIFGITRFNRQDAPSSAVVSPASDFREINDRRRDPEARGAQPGRQSVPPNEVPRPVAEKTERRRDPATPAEPAVGEPAGPVSPGGEVPATLRTVLEAYPELNTDSLLRKQVVDFFNEPHPAYGERRKIDIIRETMDLDVRPSMKILKLKSEMGRR